MDTTTTKLLGTILQVALGILIALLYDSSAKTFLLNKGCTMHRYNRESAERRKRRRNIILLMVIILILLNKPFLEATGTISPFLISLGIGLIISWTDTILRIERSRNETEEDAGPSNEEKHPARHAWNRKKIIFLDFDGVLTTARSGYRLDPDLMSTLGDLLSKTDAGIVITSSWRQETVAETIANITDPLNDTVGENPFPFCERIVGVTPRCEAWYRGMELDEWFSREGLGPEGCRYAIIDDETAYDAKQKEHLVKTDPDKGITEEDVRRALSLLE